MLRSEEDTFPYMIEAVKPSVPVALPRRVPCRAACDQADAFVLCPQSRMDVLRCAEQIKCDRTVQCLLLAETPPSDDAPNAVTHADLVAWAAEAEPLALHPVGCISTQDGRLFHCGNEARCSKYRESLEREQLEHLTALINQSKSLDSAIDAAFPKLKLDQRRMLQLWAHHEDRKDPDRPIRLKELAKRFRVSVRTVNSTLELARNENPDVYFKLKTLRHFRYQRAGYYEVRD